jgi:type II secretory pathway pseudopilin PulG
MNVAHSNSKTASGQDRPGANRRSLAGPRGQGRAGFTLLEVMFACGIFFVASFAILGLVSSSLKNARGLQRIEVDAGMAAAQVVQLFKTNRDPDLSISGDFGDIYPDYSWDAQSSEFDTNGLLQVTIEVNRRGARNNPVDGLSILVYNPNVNKSGPGPRFR